MILKFLAPFQEDNPFFQSNKLVIGCSLSESVLHSGIFWNYVKIDNSWEFDKSYIFPVFLTGDLEKNFKILFELKEFIFHNHQLFDKILKLTILNTFECQTAIIPIIDEISKLVNLHFIGCDYKLQFKNNTFNYIYVNYLGQILDPTIEIINYTPKKLYINLNRSIRYHRCFLMYELIQHNLIKNGYNTWYNVDDDIFNTFPQFKRLQVEQYDQLDVTDMSDVNQFCYTTPISFCEESFLFLVTETYSHSDITYITEKAYKPISIGMPFMILGTPGTLSCLRNMGYITFSDWLDERYDLDLPMSERVSIIINNLNFIKELTDERKIQLREEMKPVCEYNLQLYTILRKKDRLFESLKLINQELQ